jgi:threonine/homoserine/homoserine lactone efflux protein
MLTAVIIGAVIGFILAMPPGPVAMACVKVGLQNGRRECFELSIGTALMDTVYCVIAIFAATAVLDSLSNFLDSNPLIYLTIQIVIVALLVYFGLSQFKKKKIESEEATLNKAPSFISTLKSRGPFLLGVAMALTNIANPTFLSTLMVMTAWVNKLDLFVSSFGTNMLFSIGFGIGNFSWLFLLAYFVMRNKHKLSETSMVRIKQFAGLTFIGFGGFLGWRLVAFTNWAQIFKIAFSF